MHDSGSGTHAAAYCRRESGDSCRLPAFEQELPAFGQEQACAAGHTLLKKKSVRTTSSGLSPIILPTGELAKEMKELENVCTHV